MARFSFLLLLLGLFQSVAFAQKITLLSSGENTSIRGLSVVDDQVAWASGSNGHIARTTDGGKTWNWQKLNGYEKFDFRDIEAFSAEKAIAVSAGSPAVILLTEDGAKSWKEVYRDETPEIFLDGMDFWDNKNGIIYGDPIQSQMQLLKTTDGGKTWKDISGNLKIKLQEGEASFAASGTNIRTLKNGHCWIATGGTQSRVFYSANFGKTWVDYRCPIIQGHNSTGPFSIAFYDSKIGIAAGGNYLQDTLRTNNLVLTFDGGKTWAEPQVSPFGYRSSIEYYTKNILFATGTSGTDFSEDGGKTWKLISFEGFHVVRKAKKGNLLLLAGSKGRIAALKF